METHTYSCAVLELKPACSCSLAMAVKEVDEASQPMSVTFPNVEQLKLEQDECIRHFITGKDVVALLPAGLFTARAIFWKLH